MLYSIILHVYSMYYYRQGDLKNNENEYHNNNLSCWIFFIFNNL